jgi:hypothetical protein
LSVDPSIPPRPLPAVLSQVKNLAVQDMFGRMAAEGFQDVREGHGCVFGFIDLERKGYLERVPDPEDGRAKIIKLTPRGLDAALTGRRLFKEIEDEWGERYGEERVALLRECVEEIAAGYLFTGATASPS